jgi:hypothetical protein
MGRSARARCQLLLGRAAVTRGLGLGRHRACSSRRDRDTPLAARTLAARLAPSDSGGWGERPRTAVSRHGACPSRRDRDAPPPAHTLAAKGAGPLAEAVAPSRPVPPRTRRFAGEFSCCKLRFAAVAAARGAPAEPRWARGDSRDAVRALLRLDAGRARGARKHCARSWGRVRPNAIMSRDRGVHSCRPVRAP